ncbi:MAG TPA: hypothetical protein VGI86_06795, partial [Acidimicrobiia bacterium]
MEHSNVTVTWNWTDNSGAGLDTNNCTTSSTSSGEGTIGLDATCKDLDGNTGTAKYTAKVDKTAPTASPTQSPDANANGWNNSDVTVDWNWTDTGGSGIDASNCTTSSTSSGQGVLELDATCQDLAGNVGTAKYTVQVDTDEPQSTPVQSPPPGAHGWQNSDTTVTWNWTDAGSGIDTNNCTTSSTSSGEAAIELTATCQDLAGNVANADWFVTVDKTTPSLAPSVAPNPVLLHGVATASPNASDSLSGVDTSACDTVVTSTPGPHTVLCSATDLAGNTATANASYVVGYNVIHITPAANTLFLTHATLPVKFQLAGAGGTAISNADAVLLPACAVTVTYPGRAATCATFNTTDHYFHANVTTPTNPKLGVPVTLAIHATVASTVVASASLTATPVPGLQVHDTA